jgi:hypothetical protein
MPLKNETFKNFILSSFKIPIQSEKATDKIITDLIICERGMPISFVGLNLLRSIVVSTVRNLRCPSYLGCNELCT